MTNRIYDRFILPRIVSSAAALLAAALWVQTSSAAGQVVFSGAAADDRQRAKIIPDLDHGTSANKVLGNNFYWGLKLDNKFEYRHDFSLKGNSTDDISFDQPALNVVTSYRPSSQTELVVSLETTPPFYFQGTGKNAVYFSDLPNNLPLELTELYARFPGFISGSEVHLGREKLSDSRHWLFNKNLDMVRLQYDNQRDITFNLAYIRQGKLAPTYLSDGSFKAPEKDVFFYASRKIDTHELAAYYIATDNLKIPAYTPRWLGLRAKGKVNGFKYWVDFSTLHGKNGTVNLDGRGFDVGIVEQGADLLYKPSIALAYAYGSGDSDSNPNRDTSFRQTGYQGNSDRLTGVSRIRYYGELFAPELSNLAISTVSAGIRPATNMSLEVVYHYYQQAHVSSQLGSSSLKPKPNGVYRDLGEEMDLMLAYRSTDQEYRYILGWFQPGAAFASATRHNALFVAFKLKYQF